MSVNDWPGRAAAVSMRQWSTLEATAERAANVDALEGLILLGSFASGTADELSDVDVIAVAAPGRFVEAWDARHRLSQDALVAWDLRPRADIAGHNWLTRDFVKVDCTIVDPDSGSRELAEPIVVLVGPASAPDRFPRISLETVRERARKIADEQEQQVFDPDQMDVGELIDWKLSELKRAVRRGRAGDAMQSSDTLRETTLRFYDRFSANDVESFDDLVSQEVTSIIGTADDEWFTDREKLRSGFGYDGLRLEGGDPQAWEEGDIGWVADRPTMHVPGLGPFRTRFTGVFRREDGTWRLVMSHFSVGVPDEEVVELQRRWLDV